MSGQTRMLGCVVLLMAACVGLAPAAETVGNHGDPSRIQFVGNQAVESRELRSALGFDLDVLLAGHPDAPLDPLLRLLEKRICDGYRHHGYPEAQATAAFVPHREIIVVTVDEGLRFRCGEIKIIGANLIPAGRFSQLLTSPAPESQPGSGSASAVPPAAAKPIWKKGDPTSFSPTHWNSKHDEIQKHFQSLGYHDVRFTAGPVPGLNGLATLEVTITDEGPRAVLGEIEVIGAGKNTPEEVIQYLDVAKGSLLDSDLKLRVEQKLRDAARFLSHEVEIITPPFGDADSILRITLVEYAEAPKLTEEFSAEETAMINLARWLDAVETTDDDFEVHLSGPLTSKVDLTQQPDAGTLLVDLRLLISHRQQGCLLHAKLKEHPERELFEIWIHLNPRTIALFSPRHLLRFEAKNVQQCVMGTAQIKSQRPDDKGRMTTMFFGMGVRSNRNQRLPPFMLRMSAAPVSVIREVHVHRDKFRLSDGVLSMAEPGRRIRIEEKTGRLMELKIEPGPQAGMSFRFKPGIYQEVLDQYERLSQGSRLIRADHAPISSFLSFLATVTPAPVTENDRGAIAALVQSILKRGAFSAFDNLLTGFFDRPDDQFKIPHEDEPGKKPPQAGWAVLALPVARGLAPNPSWTWTIAREYVFVQSRRSPYSERAILALLNSTETGPVASMTAATLFGMLSPPLKTAFARRGLAHLKREHFRNDYEPFLNDGSTVGKLLLATAQSLQEIDAAEIETLVKHLPLDEIDRTELSRVLWIFPTRASAPPADVLREAFDEAWESLIAPRVSAYLNSIAN